MSNKNLKVYQIQFLTEIRKLHFNVKFPCQLKVTWKRSNQSAETTLVPVQNGVVNFNQLLRLSVNMYFDTTTNKFVEKKCSYSFLISTQKGEKSAGTVYLDLAQFFNKRIYEMDQSFTLEKCPVAGTKVEMKISYEQDTKQKGYDSMSCISATNPLDLSTASLDLGEFSAGRSDISEKHSQIQTQKSSKSDKALSQSGVGFGFNKQENFDKLDASDIVQYPISNSGQKSDGSKIGENIKTINTLTSKINDFVNTKSQNIRFQVEGFKRRIAQLEEQAQSQRLAKQRFQKLFEQEKKKLSTLNREYLDFKTDAQHKIQAEKRKNSQLQAKSLENQNLIGQLEARMNQSGQSQSSYISQLKSNAQATEHKLSLEINELRDSLVLQKKVKNQQNSKIQELEALSKDLKIKYTSQIEKNNNLQESMRRKEGEIEETRINLEKAFDNLVKSLSTVI